MCNDSSLLKRKTKYGGPAMEIGSEIDSGSTRSEIEIGSGEGRSIESASGDGGGTKNVQRWWRLNPRIPTIVHLSIESRAGGQTRDG